MEGGILKRLSGGLYRLKWPHKGRDVTKADESSRNICRCESSGIRVSHPARCSQSGRLIGLQEASSV
jgi:hypothetical protein